MAKLTKRQKAIAESYDANKQYTLAEAVEILNKLPPAKFKESIDIAINLGVDPRKSDQVVRGATNLPAGTGKTYTAVALAVKALKNKEVKRIILTRPAVEAGENLGFLPGDLKEKIDPYLRPLYDALDDMIPADKLKLYLENRTIEIAPLAFMRGRTLDNAFVILDEGQNATDMQLKMFLTRMGPTAKFIVTGDVTQIDLPKKSMSGLFNAITILKNISGIDIIYLTGEDVVRHKLVKKILEAYGDIQ